MKMNTEQKAKDILDYILTCLGEYRTEDERYKIMLKEIKFMIESD